LSSVFDVFCTPGHQEGAIGRKGHTSGIEGGTNLSNLLSLDQIPSTDGMSTGRKKRLAVGCKCEGVNVAGLVGEFSPLLARGDIPLANVPVLSTTSQVFAIRGESDCINLPHGLDLAKLLFVDYIPDGDAFESYSRQQPAI